MLKVEGGFKTVVLITTCFFQLQLYMVSLLFDIELNNKYSGPWRELIQIEWTKS